MYSHIAGAMFSAQVLLELLATALASTNQEFPLRHGKTSRTCLSSDRPARRFRGSQPGPGPPANLARAVDISMVGMPWDWNLHGVFNFWARRQLGSEQRENHGTLVGEIHVSEKTELCTFSGLGKRTSVEPAETSEVGLSSGRYSVMSNAA